MKYIIGIDEVGRGSLAGPVTVAAVAAPAISNFQFLISKRKLRDSKKLSAKQREEIFKIIKKLKLPFVVISVSPKIIDKINISQAANLAATRAFQKLITRYSLDSKFCKIFLDGGLYLKNQNLKTKTIIKGDEKIPAIALASIVAKVTRDRLMIRTHKKFPKYNFKKNKGYGTKEHFRAIKKHGSSLIHRKSFKLK